MERKELANALTEILLSQGFKKKGSCWVLQEDEITKIIVLQKSQYGNRFYINYGYVLQSIPLDNEIMHIFHGFGSKDQAKNERIKELLNLGNSISKEERVSELKLLVRDIPKSNCFLA